MEAVKFQNPVQVKRAASRTAAADPKTSGGDFVKLLKEKKELAEPGDPKTDQTEGKKDQSQQVKDQTAETVKEKPGKAEKDPAPAEDLAGQDVLLQAVIQQAAVQVTVLPQSEEAAPEAVLQTGETLEGIAPADSISVEGEDLAVSQDAVSQSAVGTVEKPQEPVFEQKGQEENTSPKEENSQVAQDEAPLKHASAGRKPEESRNEAVQPVKKEQAPVQRQEHGEQKGGVQEAAYTAHDVKGQSEAVAPQHKMEPIPLKTSEANLPQDLGKTLSARLPGGGQELTVELEPAYLGKLTIKLVYEGERAAVSIIASNPRTLELLSEKAAEIASILEEKTGQETVIYTQPASQEHEEPDSNQSHGGRQDQGERHENREEDRHQTESFAQQLRLGLV